MSKPEKTPKTAAQLEYEERKQARLDKEAEKMAEKSHTEKVRVLAF
jgi:hypothetical protein